MVDEHIVYRAENFIGESPQVKKIFETVQEIGKSSAPVLITGETGTGKELIAGAIHYNSTRSDQPFVKLDCTGLREDILYRELYGNDRSGLIEIYKSRKSRCEEAHTGTLLLGGIEGLSFSMQDKLHEVLRDRSFKRGTQTIPADFRLISTTSKDLLHEVQQHRFREKLYIRISTVTINIPPLRERQGDVVLLTYFFLNKFYRDLRKKVKGVNLLAIKFLTQYSWPGNIQELENTIRRAVRMANGKLITPMDLYLPLRHNLVKWNHSKIGIPPEGIKLEELEKNLVLQALKMCDWIKEDTADLLGISHRVLNHKIHRFGITHPSWENKQERQ
jgi:DNA-binding NtrC family response regulator